jgi:hypothetical protein
VELADDTIQLGQRHLLHLAVPLMVVVALRKDHDGLVPLAVALERGTEADAHLLCVVRASLTASVEIEDDRPAVQLRIVLR